VTRVVLVIFFPPPVNTVVHPHCRPSVGTTAEPLGGMAILLVARPPPPAGRCGVLEGVNGVGWFFDSPVAAGSQRSPEAPPDEDDFRKLIFF